MTSSSIENTLFIKAASQTSKYDGRPLPRVLLTEGDDPRMQEAAQKIVKIGFARPILVSKTTLNLGFEGIEEIVPVKHDTFARLVAEYKKLREGKGESDAELKATLENPLFFGGMYLRTGMADGAVSGAVNTTADVFRAGIRCLGTASGVKTASSFFLMILQDGRTLTYADCGLLPYPTSEELADIAISAAANHEKLIGEVPKVAMLSFSTKGSAKHERVEHVLKAFEIVKARKPDLLIDAELQFDAAFVPTVAARKNPRGVIKGDANVFIFPNLDAGNIAYKITERIGGAKAIGPLLQGMSRPWMDLSRGCSADDIVLVAAVAAIMSS